MPRRTTRRTNGNQDRLSHAVRTDPAVALADVAAAAMAVWSAVLDAADRDPRPRTQVKQLLRRWRESMLKAVENGIGVAEELHRR